MQLTAEQEQAARLLQKGGNVSVQAIPGAGKTALLVRTCLLAPKPCLILAYNVQLATDIKRAISEADLGADVACLTFHSLCTRTLAPARDDVGILQAVNACRNGLLTPRDVPEARRVLIDESQDVRELYIQLLQILSLCAPHVPTMVVGDRMQLIYDFDPDFPATEDTLLNPEQAFGGGQEWTKIVLSQSHRLTRPMASLARLTFGTDIHSTRHGLPVEVRVGNAFKLFHLLEDVMMEEGIQENMMLLVDKKKSNRPLCLLLNELSKHGMNIHVHGIDSEDPASTDGKLRCSTWWAAKGMQMHTIVCMVPRFTPRNPLYVGLTRAFHRLIVVLNEKEPHYNLCRSLTQLPSDMVVMNEKSRRIVADTASGNAEDSFDEEQAFAIRGDVRMRPLDNWRAPRTITTAFQVADGSEGHDAEDLDSCVHMSGGFEDTASACLRTALVAAEFEATGRVRAMDDIVHPTKLEPTSYSMAVRCGLASRYISCNRPANDVLLAWDLFHFARDAYLRMQTKRDKEEVQTTDDFAVVALAVLAWDSYDHTMRQLLPASEWCHREIVLRAIEIARTTLPSALDGITDYDVRSRVLYRDSLMVVRTHAVNTAMNFLAVWGEDKDCPSHETMTQGALRAAMHPRKTCLVVDLLKGWTKRVQVDAPDVVLSMVE